MSLGRTADHVAGRLSRILHGVRGPRINTIADLEPYLDRTAEEFFPAPAPLEDVRVHGSVLSRFSRTTTLSWKSSHQVFSPRYRVRHEGEYRANGTAWARWIRPEGRRRRSCLVYVHGWLEPGSWIEELFIFPRWTEELDVDVVHVSLPFHGRRNPWNALFSGEFFWTADLVRSFEGVRQAVCDIRSMMGWLRRQGYERVGAAGISLGGSLAMILACVPDPPDFVVPIVAHLLLGEAVEHAQILWRMKNDLERWGVGAAERRRIFHRVGFDRYRPLLPPERQLWIEAEEDGHIDPVLVRRQWEAWNRPNIHWIPGGHMTFPLHLPEIAAAMRAFLAEQTPSPEELGSLPQPRAR
jgi:hypothetical protein